jgi:GAF domain-containing protein
MAVVRLSADHELAQALAAVARELVDTGDVQDTLQRIVTLAVQTIPSCDHAGLSLVTRGRIETHAQTDPPVPHMIDRIQNDTGEGPAVDAIRRHQVFESGDLARERRWPRFAPAVAEQTDVRSVLSIRLFITDEDTMGSINLYAETVEAFDDVDRSVASIFAAHAAVALKAAQKSEQLTAAMENRHIIGQATGIIMARRQVDDATAFEMLREGSMRLNRKLHAVAQQVVDDEHRS